MTCCRCMRRLAEWRTTGDRVVLLLCGPCVWVQPEGARLRVVLLPERGQ